MATPLLTCDDLAAAAAQHRSDWADEVVVVDLDAGGTRVPPAWEGGGGRPAVLIGLTAAPVGHEHPAAPLCDVVLPHDDVLLARVLRSVAATPVAARALVVHMRSAPHPTIEAGLAAESAVYSTLQAGPEFAAWLATRTRRAERADGDPVRVARTGDVLDITLQRPEVRNALSAAMRDALIDAFAVAAFDPSIAEVHLRGDGPSFCAGGDLDEFGTFADPATAHVVRLQRSVGRMIAAVAERVTAHLHGACAGSGIELPAFAARVVADASTTISLPELSLGLIPGAGGTVSLTRRIGRHRTTRLALTGETLDTRTALEWGLVDSLDG